MILKFYKIYKMFPPGKMSLLKKSQLHFTLTSFNFAMFQSDHFYPQPWRHCQNPL